MKAEGKYTQELWLEAQDVYQKILSCKFVKQLADGSLCKESFGHYLTQDVLYLLKDAEALGNVGERSKNEEEKTFFLALKEDGLAVEQVLREEYLRYFNLQPATIQSSAFKAYSDFLLYHSQHSSYECACVALLPCFWIYGEVADEISKHVLANNVYQKFIDTYAGDEYDDYTKKFIQIVENLAKESNNFDEMKRVFLQACEFEYLVFDEAISLSFT